MTQVDAAAVGPGLGVEKVGWIAGVDRQRLRAHAEVVVDALVARDLLQADGVGLDVSGAPELDYQAVAGDLLHAEARPLDAIGVGEIVGRDQLIFANRADLVIAVEDRECRVARDIDKRSPKRRQVVVAGR